METNSNQSLLVKSIHWMSNSTSLKLILIGLIVLVLLIPQAFTVDLINERQTRLEEAEKEITSKWSGAQTIIGPYLAIPYHHFTEKTNFGEKKSGAYLKMVSRAAGIYCISRKIDWYKNQNPHTSPTTG